MRIFHEKHTNSSSRDTAHPIAMTSCVDLDCANRFQATPEDALTAAAGTPLQVTKRMTRSSEEVDIGQLANTLSRRSQEVSVTATTFHVSYEFRNALCHQSARK